jgi:hypothetical protein
MKQVGVRVCFVRARLAFVRAALEATRVCLTHGRTSVGRSRVRVRLRRASLRVAARGRSPTGTRLMFRGAGLSLREAVRSLLPLRLRVWERPLGLEGTRSCRMRTRPSREGVPVARLGLALLLGSARAATWGVRLAVRLGSPRKVPASKTSSAAWKPARVGGPAACAVGASADGGGVLTRTASLWGLACVPFATERRTMVADAAPP